MLPKKSRNNKKDLNLIFNNKAIFLYSANLSFRYLRSSTNKFSFIVGKSFNNKAVERNLLKRQGFDAIKKQTHLLRFPINGVFIVKGKKTMDLNNEIKEIFNKVN